MLEVLFVFDYGAELRLIDKALLDVYGLHEVVIDAQADVGFGQVFQALDYETVQGYALPMRQVPAEAAIDGADVDFAIYEITAVGLLAYELVALVFHVAEEFVEQIGERDQALEGAVLVDDKAGIGVGATQLAE